MNERNEEQGSGSESSWAEYRRLVISELSANKKAIDTLSAKIDDFQKRDLNSIRVDIAMLQVKAGVWGALAGLIPVVLFFVWEVVKK